MGFIGNLKDVLTLKRNVESLQTETQHLNLEIAKMRESILSLNQQINYRQSSISSLEAEVVRLKQQREDTFQKISDNDKKIEGQKKRLKRAAELIKSINAAALKFAQYGQDGTEKGLESNLLLLEPSLTLKSPGETIKDIRYQMNENKRMIEDVLKAYQGRYTTKLHASLYALLVIALRAELQNLKLGLRFNKLETAIEAIKEMSRKYLAIVAEGNQSIAPTMTRFIAQIEVLFCDALRIEYEYYIKQEQIREEQKAIREQMRQEAEERRLLEIERKKLEAEEKKYLQEMENLQQQVKLADPESEAVKILLQRISELEQQVSGIEEKKGDVLRLQNGMAGHVYIISNLGAFGDEVFKIGMTRRLVPQERIKELGDASVPFEFDIHALVFSDNAVSMENKLHQHFDLQRVNKINRRKEFFRVSIDELEAFVNEIEPTAAFETTMLAEQYRQSLAVEEGLIELTAVIEDNNEDDEADAEEVEFSEVVV